MPKFWGLPVGTWAEWVAAFGTTAAFIVALFLLRKELKNFQETREDKRRAHATRVSGWFSFEESGTTSYVDVGTGIHAMRPDGTWSILMRNGSPEPIYQCSLVMGGGENDEVEKFSFSVIPPETTLVERLAHPRDKRLYRESVGEMMALGESQVEIRTVLRPALDLWTEISFVDSNDRRWIRDRRGHLSQLKAKDKS